MSDQSHLIIDIYNIQFEELTMTLIDSHNRKASGMDNLNIVFILIHELYYRLYAFCNRTSDSRR